MIRGNQENQGLVENEELVHLWQATSCKVRRPKRQKEEGKAEKEEEEKW